MKEQSKKMDEIKGVIREQGLKNTQLLEVMARQQNDAQTAAAAARAAQNESLRSFQDTIASVVVTLSQRPPTAMHLPEKDPKFPDLDGYRKHLLLWLHQVDIIRQTKEISDHVAMRFARHAMGVAAYGHFKEVPPTWAAFVKVLEDLCMPSDIKNRLTEELWRLRMDGNDFSRYFSQLQAYCQHMQTTDESMLLMTFVRGLENHPHTSPCPHRRASIAPERPPAAQAKG